MMTFEYYRYDATQLAELIRNREVTEREVIESCIQQIESVNPLLNAVVTTLLNEIDPQLSQLSQHTHALPFYGVPFLLNDLGQSYQGYPTSAGNKHLASQPIDFDSPLTQRYKQTGVIILGKTNNPEFGFSHLTEPELFGPCHNPWGLEYVSGGASGGACAAVASGLVPMAHATDVLGSIRIPASCCGLVGLKPTHARTPTGPTDLFGWMCDHVVTRSVRDSAMMLDHTHGHHTDNRYFAPPIEGSFCNSLVRPRKMKLAFCPEALSGGRLHPDCRQAVEQTVKTCLELGHQVEQIKPLPLETLYEHVFVLECAYAAETLHALQATGIELKEENFEPLTWAYYQTSKQLTCYDLATSLSALNQMAQNIRPLLNQFDGLIYATLRTPPLPIGSQLQSPEQVLTQTMAFLNTVPLANILGHPTLSLPATCNAIGLPIGISIMAQMGAEQTLLNLARQLEIAQPWHQRMPQVFAGNAPYSKAA